MYKASFIYKTSFTLDAKPAKPENDTKMTQFRWRSRIKPGLWPSFWCCKPAKPENDIEPGQMTLRLVDWLLFVHCKLNVIFQVSMSNDPLNLKSRLKMTLSLAGDHVPQCVLLPISLYAEVYSKPTLLAGLASVHCAALAGFITGAATLCARCWLIVKRAHSESSQV